MGISLKDIFKNDEERLVENKRKTTIRNIIIFICALFVFIIVAVIIRYWGNQDEDRRKAITKDVQNIRIAILSRAEQTLSDPSLGDYPGKSLQDEGVTLSVNGVVEEYRYGYYLLESGDLKEIAVSLNLPNEVYFVNYETGDVVNGTGIKYNGRRYHSYDDLVAIENGEVPISDRTVIISNASDLNKIRSNSKGYFKLSANIDMSEYNAGEGWIPIESFEGILDGRGYTISNLKINRTAQNLVGLFGDVKSNAKISNLTLENVNIIGGEFTGSLAGNCSGTITNVHVSSGNVTGLRNSTGGLVGAFSIEKIINCTVKADVDGDKNVGGIIGTLYSGTINRVSADGSVAATENAGGLIGLARISDITYINECATHMAVNGKNNLGGLVGSVEMTASRKLEIINSYAKGSIETGETNIGGMFGQIYTTQGTPDVILRNLYASVSVVVKGETSGGFIGYCRVGGATTQVYDNCFWEKAIAPGEVLNDVGKSSEGSTMTFVDKTTQEMRIMRMYTTWNFESIWEIEERVSTPTLRWEKNYIVEENKDEK